MSNFRSYGESLNVDRPLAGLLKLPNADDDGPTTVQLYLPQIEVRACVVCVVVCGEHHTRADVVHAIRW